MAPFQQMVIKLQFIYYGMQNFGTCIFLTTYGEKLYFYGLVYNLYMHIKIVMFVRLTAVGCLVIVTRSWGFCIFTITITNEQFYFWHLLVSLFFRDTESGFLWENLTLNGPERIAFGIE